MYCMELVWEWQEKWNDARNVKWNGKVIYEMLCDMSYVKYKLYEYDVNINCMNMILDKWDEK